MPKVMSIKYCVVRDYSAHVPGLGSVTCADFYNEEDARAYYSWQQRARNAEARKFGNPNYVWKLFKRTEYFPGEHPSGYFWELLEG